MKILRKLEVYLRDRRLRRLEEVLGWNLMTHADVILELVRRYEINLVLNCHIMRLLNEYRNQLNKMSEAIDSIHEMPEKADEIK